jgi:hypothetical protein
LAEEIPLLKALAHLLAQVHPDPIASALAALALFLMLIAVMVVFASLE